MLAKQMILAELTEGALQIKNLHWCTLNSYIDPPEGVRVVSSFLYYIHYLASDDQEKSLVDLNRLKDISFNEVKKSMFHQNFYKFLMKYDLLCKDTLPRLSFNHMKKIVNLWKSETDRLNLTIAQHNTQMLIPVWLTVDNIVMAMYN